eukprot:gene35455-42975_t
MFLPIWSMGGSKSSETSRFCPFSCVYWTSACWSLFDWSSRTGGETVALNQETVALNHGAFSYKQVLIVLGAMFTLLESKGRQWVLSPFNTLAASLLRYYLAYSLSPHVFSTIYARISDLRLYGRYIAGDEKLFHFTGDSAFIRSVPSKPDAIGLSCFELACKIADKEPYMLHIWLSESSTALGLRIPVSSVTEKWAKIAKEQNPPPLVTFDSYYMDLRGTRLISSMGVPYIGALHPSRFPAMVAMMTPTSRPWQLAQREHYGIKIVKNCLGGHGTKEVHGNVHKLAMGVVQFNLCTACRYILKIYDLPVDFSRMCDELSISLIATGQYPRPRVRTASSTALTNQWISHQCPARKRLELESSALDRSAKLPFFHIQYCERIFNIITSYY